MSNIALKFRNGADALQKTIDAKRDPAIRSQNLTPRRARIAQGMSKDADRLEQIQTLMRKLADCHDSGNWDAFVMDSVTVRDIKSKADIERLPYGVLAQLVGPTEERPEQKLRRMEESLLGVKIPGFFPTPSDTVDRLVELAMLEPGMRVLEPSAGKGDIADGIVRYMKDFYVGSVIPQPLDGNVKLLCVEINSTLATICRAKGHNTLHASILDTDFERNEHLAPYDRIIMNPPFEKGQDIEHVMHCFDRLLAPGGRLVSIVSEAPFFRTESKYEDFREFLSKTQTQDPIKLESAFQGAQSFRQTGVNTRIIVLEKDPVWPQTSSKRSSKDSEMLIPT